MYANNFNFLRLVFALLVVITHSYALCNGSEDWLTKHTLGQISFSFIGLSGFFVISGYLIYESLERSRDLLDYFKRRVLRIFPGLFVVLLLTVVLGFAVYDYDLKSYLTNKTVWTYLPRNLFLIKPQEGIRGIFTNNPYNPAINGSLWSILYEFSFYVALSGLFFLSIKWRRIISWSVLIVLLIMRLFWANELGTINFVLSSQLVLEFAPFFVFGAVLALSNIKRLKNQRYFLLSSLVILLTFTFLRHFDTIKYFTLPPIIVLIGLSNWSLINRLLEKLGDISYGIYIYAFPVQQTLMHYNAFTVSQLMTISLTISCLFGFFSWHCVEKHAIQLK